MRGPALGQPGVRTPGKKADPRNEDDVFLDLAALARKPGFIHALAALTFRSNVVTARQEFTTDDFMKLYQPDRLIRNETNLLVGLMLSGSVDTTLQSPPVTMDYIEQAVALLEELHSSIGLQGRKVFLAALQAHAQGDEDANPLSSGVLLREAIFYGGESAFPFQYEALARERYAPDAEWLRTHMGFSIEEAADVVSAIRAIGTKKILSHWAILRTQTINEYTWLPVFTFTIEEVLQELSFDEGKVRAVIEAFTVAELDEDLPPTKLGAYNKAATHPIVRLADGTLLSLLEYSASAALYENPFYWFIKDKKYFAKHSKNRGSFAELFTERTLCSVFPPEFVHRNVEFIARGGDRVGEADAILLYGNRAFIVQAKSKRLTLASWQGDDQSIAKDFHAAVQDAYDQAVACVRHIKNGLQAYINGELIDLKRFGEIREYYPLCITSEHYPALAYQSTTSLALQAEPQMTLPIVTDVFTLEVMAEMLDNPLYFTDYLVKRAAAAGKMQVSHELVALSWYVKRNLHIEENEFIVLADDFMVELDLAMAVRKLGVLGERTPSGQLTRFQGTPAGKLLEYVVASGRPDVHRFGEILLSMDGDAADALNKGMRRAIRMASADGMQHDISLGLHGGGGITVHCNEERLDHAKASLVHHCEMRKYAQMADRWYGATVRPSGEPVIMVGLEFPWLMDAALETKVPHFKVSAATRSLYQSRKLGRNDPCPCGSGKKYKKCCLG